MKLSALTDNGSEIMLNSLCGSTVQLGAGRVLLCLASLIFYQISDSVFIFLFMGNYSCTLRCRT